MWVMNGTRIVQGVDLGPLPLTWSVAGIGDFDGNGSSDILLRDTSGNVQIWLLNGTQVLSTKMLGNVSTSWSSLRPAISTATARLTFCGWIMVATRVSGL